MTNEHIVHVIKKMRISVMPTELPHGVTRDDVGKIKVIAYYATIHDGGTLLKQMYGETYNEALEYAVNWVHKNFDVPDNITIFSRHPQDYLTEHFDKQTRLRQSYVEEE